MLQVTLERLVTPALLYNKLRLAKEIQLNMWSHFCVRTAALTGGRPQGGTTIRTRWVTWPEHTENDE